MDKKVKIDQACQSGEEFAKKFYETFDKRRHVVSKLYLDAANVTWNGNSVSGKENIGKFFESLPPSESTVTCIDAQPINDQFVQGQTTVLITAAGTMNFSGRSPYLFSESLLITAQQSEEGHVWKVVSDCFRFHEPL
ncbi:NTF2-related export protein 2 [Centruroides vittatus]|uniref:NTF2-related export protein 2 n=1 Tax=Centruroides vittatus TaxID=120091 RepID=UPI00350EEA54